MSPIINADCSWTVKIRAYTEMVGEARRAETASAVTLQMDQLFVYRAKCLSLEVPLAKDHPPPWFAHKETLLQHKELPDWQFNSIFTMGCST